MLPRFRKQGVFVFAALAVLFLPFFSLFSSQALAVPRLLTFQGRLADSGGSLLTGTVNMTFSIYTTSTGGTALWTETQSVTVETGAHAGNFSVLLGSVTTLDLDFNESAYYLGVAVASDAEMTPRQRISASAFAINTDLLDGKDSTEFFQLAPGSAQADSSTDTSLHISKTGASGNLAEMEASGTDVFVIDRDGNITTVGTVDGVDISTIPEAYLALTGGTMTGTVNANSIIPTESETYDLGSSEKYWNDLYLAGNTIYFNDTTDATIGFDTGNDKFTFNIDGTQQAEIDSSGNLALTGNLTVSGSLTGDSLTLDTLSSGDANSYDFVQTDWSGGVGVGETAIHTNNRTNWDKYSAKDNLSVGTSASIDLASAITATSDTSIDFSTEGNYTQEAEGKETKGETELVTDHKIKLEGLTPGAVYGVRVYGRDEDDNLAQSSWFDLETLTDASGPEINQIKTSAAIIPGTEGKAQVIISWKTNEPATTMLFYQSGNASEKKFDEEITDQAMTRNHVVVLTELSAGRVYRYLIASKDEYGNLTESRELSFLAPRQRESVFQLIINNLEDIFGWTSRIGA